MHVALSQEQLAEMDHWLRNVSVEIVGSMGNWEVRIDGARMGCLAEDHRCPINVEVIGPGMYGDELLAGIDKATYQTVVGPLPRQEIRIVAMCNGEIDHCVIARMAIHLARRYDGVIDMTGEIVPWDRPYGGYDVQEVRELLAGIGGTVWEVLPEAGPEASARPVRPYHVVDAAFLEAWLRHPKFHMVK